MQWRMIERLDGATADAVEFAAARGWVQVEEGHIALTEAGRLLAKDLGGSRAPAKRWRGRHMVSRRRSIAILSFVGVAS
jgi:hypothetical protein